MQTRRLAYMAHPFGGDLANLGRAERWLAYLRKSRPDLIIIAPWIEFIKQNIFKGDDVAGLAADCVIVRECEVFIAVRKRDGSLSDGTKKEFAAFCEKFRRPCDYEAIDNPIGEPPDDLESRVELRPFPGAQSQYLNSP